MIEGEDLLESILPVRVDKSNFYVYEVQKLTFITRLGLIGWSCVCRLVVVSMVKATIAGNVQSQRLRTLVLSWLTRALALLHHVLPKISQECYSPEPIH